MAMTEEAEEVEEKAPLEPQNFSIGIHAWIETAQTSHGVRHEDFGQYHGYCTRRLARLRHNPDVKKDLLHSSKYAKSNAKSNTHTSTSTVSHKGRPRHAYCARDDTAAMQVVPHSHFLWVMLVSAERAWAQASEIKKGGSRQHAIRRLHKAQQLATRLEASAKINCDAVTYKECQAYTGWMKGNWALEKGHYKVCTARNAAPEW
jgi:signal recognition particle subunit SRP68